MYLVDFVVFKQFQEPTHAEVSRGDQEQGVTLGLRTHCMLSPALLVSSKLQPQPNPITCACLYEFITQLQFQLTMGG